MLTGPTVEAAMESLSWSPAAGAELRAALGYRRGRDAVDDQRGELVRRTTAGGETWATPLGAAGLVYRKLRHGRPAATQREWRNLQVLAAAGLRVPAACFVARDGARSAVGMAAAEGRSLFELLAAAATLDAARPYLLQQVAPTVARLHQLGYVHRDLYWHHLFAARLDARDGPPVLIDLERAFRPAWRRQRWVVKDLAALLASWPRPGGERVLALAFLRAYLGGSLRPGWKALARRALRKAERMRRHSPRHDPAPGPR